MSVSPTDPAPPDEPTPDYQYTGSYENGGNPYDGPSGCSLDGQPLACSLVLRAVALGTGVGRDGGSLQLIAYYDRDPREFPPSVIAVHIPRARTSGGSPERTAQTSTPQPCDVQVPTDPNDRAVIATILGENTPYGFIGTRQYAADQYGDYRRLAERPAPTGDVITEETLYNEAAMMVSVIINRFRRGDATRRDGRTGHTENSWALVAAEPGQFEGYAAGSATLNAGNFGNNGDPECEELRLAVRALEGVTRNGVVNDSVYNWRAVLQNGGLRVRRQGRNNATRIAGTDFW